MNPTLRRLSLFAAALLSGAATLSAKAPAKKTVMSRTDSLYEIMKVRSIRVPNSAGILDVKIPRTEVGDHLFRVREHPGLDSLLTPEKEREILAAINRRCDSLGKDSLLTTDLFWASRPHLDFLYNEDPHYRMWLACPVDGRVHKSMNKFYRQVRQLPFNMLSINDTLVVHSSLDVQFRTGDRVVSINGVTAEEYLKYDYADRYTEPWRLLHNYYYAHTVPEFRVQLERNGQPLEVTTPGQPSLKSEYALRLAESMDNNIRTYADAKCGYIAIPLFFPMNVRLVRIVRKAVLDFKAQGLTNVILDLRRNPGGNGDRFDELVSIFTDKPVIKNTRNVWVKGSPRAREVYTFLTPEQDGELVPLPDDEVVREFPTLPKMYVDGMHCYVLMSKDTGSVAATFCNIMQYNDAAKLVGEPLLRNAFKYGDVLDGRKLLPTLLSPMAISITRSDDYTRAVDGVLMPDIEIPYVAADYLTGRDGVLDKLLAIIGSK